MEANPCFLVYRRRIPSWSNTIRTEEKSMVMPVLAFVAVLAGLAAYGVYRDRREHDAKGRDSSQRP